MSPLLKGPQNMRKNVTELMKGVESPSRAKAIMTLMSKYNISKEDAMMRQALAIARAQARKK